MSFLGLDDLVFLFVQGQNNILKWNLLYAACGGHSGEGGILPRSTRTDEKAETMTQEQKKLMETINMIGYEYKRGCGVSGSDGKRRYASLTKFFHKAYYSKKQDDCALVKKNRDALAQKLKEMVQEDLDNRNTDSLTWLLLY